MSARCCRMENGDDGTEEHGEFSGAVVFAYVSGGQRVEAWPCINHLDNYLRGGWQWEPAHKR